MPAVFRLDGIRFFFFSNEDDPREPPYIHARTASAEAKLWLYPVCGSHTLEASTVQPSPASLVPSSSGGD
jgi:hypothetical protein